MSSTKQQSDPRLSGLETLAVALHQLHAHECRMLVKPTEGENRLLGRIKEKAQQLERAIDALAEKLPKPPEPPRPPPWQLWDGENCSACANDTEKYKTVSFESFDEDGDSYPIHLCAKCLEDARLTLERGPTEPETST